MNDQVEPPATNPGAVRSMDAHRNVARGGLERRPAHVPEWVWEGYKGHVAKISQPDWQPEYLVALTADARVRLITQIVSSKNSGLLWRMLEANWDELDRECGGPDPERHVVNIFEATEIMLHDIHPQQRLTADQRRPFANAVEEAAKDLSSALRRVRALSRPECPEYPMGFPHFDHDDFMALLEKMAHGARQWRSATPEFPRPQKPGSARRYFIAAMAQHLQQLYPSASMSRAADLLADCIDFEELELAR